MPIGAAIGGAAIAGVGTVAAGAMSSSAQKKAAQTASDSSLAVAQLNNQTFRDTRDQNLAIASPFYNNGIAAGNALSGLLLGPQAPTSTAPSVGALGAAPDSGGGYGSGALDAYLSANPDVGRDYATNPRISHNLFPTAEDYAAWHYQNYGAKEGRAAPAVNVPAPAPPSANYQFRYDQGLKATEGNYATKGALDSGAAEKAKITFGQNFASNELGNYMNLLASQQAAGLTAAGAVMGVNTNYAGNVTAQNTNAANVGANAALVAGQANANMWGGVGQTAGQLGGALFQYGMGKSMTPATISPASWNSVPTSLPSAQPLPYLPGGF
jgi:hypothetical protein